jgi:hypothetical protein
VSVKIRNLILGEELPERLRTGYEKTTMPEWFFVAERDGKVVAILITAPAHVFVILIRLLAVEGGHPMDVRSLLVDTMRTIKQRGYIGYVAWLDPKNPAEKCLMDIIEQSGGGQWERNQVACYGAA